MITTTQQNPMKTFNYNFRRSLAANGNWQQAEEYRIKLTTPEAGTITDTPGSVKALQEKTESEETFEPKELTRDEIVKKLKAKGVKGVHFIKDDAKLIERAKEHGII